MKKKHLKIPESNYNKKTFNIKIIINKIFNYKIEIIIFLISTTISLLIIYSEKLDPYPPGSDASYYVIAGENIANIIKNLPTFLYSLFSHSYTASDYYQMGLIDPTGVSTIFRSPTYGIYLALLILFFGKGVNVFILSQIILLGLIFIQIYKILSNYLSLKINLLITFLSMFHYSFYLSASHTETEIFLTLFILIAFRLFIKLINNPTKNDYFYFGFLLIIISAIKSSMQYFFIIFLFTIIIILKFKYKQEIKKYVKPLIWGLAIPLFLLTLFYSMTNNKFGLMATGAGGRNLYHGQCYKTDCFSFQGAFQNKWYIEEARKISNSFNPNNWFILYSDVCKKAFIKTLVHDTIPFITYTIKKSFWLNAFPPNNAEPYMPKFEFLQGYYLIIFHLTFFILAVFSILFFNNKFYEKLFILIVFLYHMGIHSLTVMDTRYFLPLIPFYIILSSLWIKEIKHIKINRNLIKAFIILILILIISLIKNPLFFNEYLNFYIFKIIAFNILLICFFIFLIRKFIKNYTLNNKIVFILFFFYIYLSLNITLITKKNILNTVINTNNQINQKIVISQNDHLKNYEEFYLLLDNNTTNIDVYFNSNKLNEKIMYTQSPILCAPKKIWTQKEPKWKYIKVPIELINETNFITIKSKQNLIINADYLTKKIKYFPSFIYTLVNKPFLYGYCLGKNLDKRAYLKLNLKSLENKTINNNFALKKRARIFLLGKRKGNYYINQKFSYLSPTHSGFLSLLRLNDRKIISYKEKPEKNDVIINGKLIDVIIGEIDNFYSGYDVF